MEYHLESRDSEMIEGKKEEKTRSESTQLLCWESVEERREALSKVLNLCVRGMQMDLAKSE